MIAPDIEVALNMDLVSILFREYAQELGEDLCFQGFEEELASLPGKYGPPRGSILLARIGNDDAGIVALRPYEAIPGSCEMKRMYVRPRFRGLGMGRLLAEAILVEAKRMEYEKMFLDTFERLESAVALYKSLGFEEIDPYYSNPMPGVIYMSKAL